MDLRLAVLYDDLRHGTVMHFVVMQLEESESAVDAAYVQEDTGMTRRPESRRAANCMRVQAQDSMLGVTSARVARRSHYYHHC
jgi:hypothetical protein